MHFLNKLESLEKLVLLGEINSEVELNPKFQWNHLKLINFEYPVDAFDYAKKI